MSITIEQANEILKKHGIDSEAELKKALKKSPIEIGMFTMPLSNAIEENGHAKLS